MSDHCQFVLFPVGGAMRVVDGHPTATIISDAIGGALPVPILPDGGSAALWLRETCATEGQPRNVLASLAFQILNRGSDPPPVLGPAAITMFGWSAGPGLVSPVGVPMGFSPMMIEGLEAMVGDLSLALAGVNEGFRSGITAEWADAVRKAADRILALPLPDDYPYCGLRRAPGLEMPWSGLARSFGDGRTYMEMPLPG